MRFSLRFGRRRPRGPPRDDAACEGARRERIGRSGERAAVAALRAAGYRVVARNVRTLAGEIDVVAFDGPTIALVEVKATAASSGPSPAIRVDHAKRKRLKNAWKVIARGAGWATTPYRFDIVAVRLEDGHPTCRISKGAFRASP